MKEIIKVTGKDLTCRLKLPSLPDTVPRNVSAILILANDNGF